MAEGKGIIGRSRRILVLFCTLLLAGSLFTVLGVTVWAQDTPAEEPAGTPAEQPEQKAQPASGQRAGGLTVDYWEPQVGQRTVYYEQDDNDIHGQLWGTGTLGYWDDYLLYGWSVGHYLYPIRVNWSSSHYKTVDAVSNMNMVYFDLVGPWYFNMTTPYKYLETVIGIDKAPDAALFPQATFAVEYLFIDSGGHRIWGTIYRSNDSAAKKWYEWGGTVEYHGADAIQKETIRYCSPGDRATPVPLTLAAFPMSVGTTGTIEAVYMKGGRVEGTTVSGSYEVIADGKVTVPAGTHEALMLRYNFNSPPNGGSYTRLGYAWMVQGMGYVAEAGSLPNELGPLFKEATEIMVMEEQTGTAAAQK